MPADAGRPHVPRVSIGLPTYNGQAFLPAAIESILTQTYADFELIISDNGSTDGTPALCQDFAARDARVRLLRSTTNHGAAWNHNRVAAAARGEYFMWSSDDDFFAPTYLETCVRALDMDPGVVYCYAESIVTDSDGRILGREVDRGDVGNVKPDVRFWEYLVVRGGENTYGLMRAAVLRRIAPHRTFPWAERVLFAELCLYGRFMRIPGRLYFRRMHPGQITALRADSRREAVILDPRRAPRWRHVRFLMSIEYVLGFGAAIWRAPLSIQQRIRCYQRMVRWMLSKVPGFYLRDPRTKAVVLDESIAESAVVWR